MIDELFYVQFDGQDRKGKELGVAVKREIGNKPRGTRRGT